MTGGATAGSSRVYRLDPDLLPARAPAGSAGPGTAFVVDRERAVLRRQAATGTSLVAIPISAYIGVAVRVEPADAAGTVIAYVELLHRDPLLTLPLVVADEPQSIASDWRAWGRALNMPLLVIARDGTVIASLDTLGAVTVREPKPRRRAASLRARRPRFLMRRKPGRRGPAERIAAREIIARD